MLILREEEEEEEEEEELFARDETLRALFLAPLFLPRKKLELPPPPEEDEKKRDDDVGILSSLSGKKMTKNACRCS